MQKTSSGKNSQKEEFIFVIAIPWRYFFINKN